ncbi:MAG: hypothetical protein ABI210_14860 [Abditibacteriaceae bacterium]
MPTTFTAESPAPAHRWIQNDYAEPDLFLMADDTLIEEADNAQFHLCPLEKEPKPIMLPTETWEGGDGKSTFAVHQDPIDGSVVYDAQNEQYVMWYRTHNRLITPSSGSVVCMATSKDGLNWEKPALRQVFWNGSYENNMLRVDVEPIQRQHLSGVLPNYLEGQSGLVATVYSTFDDDIYPYGITQLYSEDGVIWEPHFPPTIPLDRDANCLMWDSRRKCYLCTTRSEQQQRVIHRLQISQGLHHLTNKRHVALAKSRDLLHWTPMITILEADDRDPENAQMYYMYIIPYGRHYLGFVQMFYMADGMTFGPLDMHLAISDDGETWRRAGDKWGERTPFIPRGEAGTWDCSHISQHSTPPFPIGAQGERLRFWYGGKDTEHWQAGNTAVGTGTLRRDGFACWEAGAEGGTITTRPLQMKWATRPSINVNATNGEVRVEILQENGEPLEGCSAAQCTPITGDHIRAVLHWPGQRDSFVRHAGKVRVRFHLKNAKIYAAKLPRLEAENDDIN